MSSTLPTLDRSRHFGTVVPPEDDAHYHQDGFYFDREGKLIEAMLDDVGKTKLKRLQTRAVTKAAARRAIVDALVNEGFDDSEAEKIADEDTADDAITDVETPDDKVDLVRWAKGTRRYLWSQVAKTAKEEHHFGATSKIGLVDFLVSEGIVNRDEVKV